jgi:succinylglutamate desuccinylase
VSEELTGLSEATSKYNRVLGLIKGEPHGPTIIVTAAIHGNEITGIKAAERVVARLESDRPPVRGRLLLLGGNLAALREHTRFVDLDLNRQWTPEKVARLVDAPPGGAEAVEDTEQRDLVKVMRDEIAIAQGPIYFLDMHTSSAEGPPFLTVGDTLLNRRFAANFPLPVILGLEEQVDGSLLEFLNNYGIVTLGIEAGQHDSQSSIDRLEAVLWLALVAARFIDASAVQDLQDRRRMLSHESRDIPRTIEVRHRHAIEPADAFQMEPGFSNFQSIRKGQILARDNHGLVLCPEDGLVLLPLYQGKGDDGFFVARELRPFWLRVSAALRRLRIGRLVKYLPGVRPHPDLDGVLIVNTRIVRLYPLDTFHLFGFRKLRREGVDLLVSRRKYDLSRPERVRFP